MHDIALAAESFEFAMSGNQQSSAWCFVASTRLDSDEAVLEISGPTRATVRSLSTQARAPDTSAQSAPDRFPSPCTHVQPRSRLHVERPRPGASRSPAAPWKFRANTCSRKLLRP